MRKLTVVVVAAMILLAGCSGGGGGAASPTEEGTDAPATGTSTEGTPAGDLIEGTPMEPTTPDDDSSSEPTPLSAVSSDDSLAEATEIDGTWYNGTEQTRGVTRNDTSNNRELVKYTDESGTTSAVYTTEDYVAVRNGTTGDVEYGGPDSFIGFGVSSCARFTATAPLFYVGVVEWEQSGTTTVDGEQAVVYESSSLNETTLSNSQNLDLGFEQSEVQSVDGEIVIRSDGRIDSVTIEIEAASGTYGGETSIEYDDITVSQPDWVNESEAP